MRLVKAQFSHTWATGAGTAPSVCTKGTEELCREAELKYMGSHFWASSAFSPSRFLQNKGAQNQRENMSFAVAPPSLLGF